MEEMSQKAKKKNNTFHLLQPKPNYTADIMQYVKRRRKRNLFLGYLFSSWLHLGSLKLVRPGARPYLYTLTNCSNYLFIAVGIGVNS
jgi:hypothetical protein